MEDASWPQEREWILIYYHTAASPNYVFVLEKKPTTYVLTEESGAQLEQSPSEKTFEGPSCEIILFRFRKTFSVIASI